jgi:hypothetical protein
MRRLRAMRTITTRHPNDWREIGQIWLSWRASIGSERLEGESGHWVGVPARHDANLDLVPT